MGTLDEFLASLRQAGVTSVTLQFTPADRQGVPSSGDAPAPPVVVAAESNTPDAREVAEARAAADAAQAEEDMWAATPLRPANVEALMSECDEEFGAWQSEQVAAVEHGSVLVVERIA